MSLHLRDQLLALDHLKSMVQKGLRRNLDDDVVKAVAGLDSYSKMERMGDSVKKHILDPGKVLTYTFEDAAMLPIECLNEIADCLGDQNPLGAIDVLGRKVMCCRIAARFPLFAMQMVATHIDKVKDLLATCKCEKFNLCKGNKTPIQLCDPHAAVDLLVSNLGKMDTNDGIIAVCVGFVLVCMVIDLEGRAMTDELMESGKRKKSLIYKIMELVQEGEAREIEVFKKVARNAHGFSSFHRLFLSAWVCRRMMDHMEIGDLYLRSDGPLEPYDYDSAGQIDVFPDYVFDKHVCLNRERIDGSLKYQHKKKNWPNAIDWTKVDKLYPRRSKEEIRELMSMERFLTDGAWVQPLPHDSEADRICQDMFKDIAERMYAKDPADELQPVFANTEWKAVKRKTVPMLELLRDMLTKKMPDLFAAKKQCPPLAKKRCPPLAKKRCADVAKKRRVDTATKQGLTEEQLDNYKKKYEGWPMLKTPNYATKTNTRVCWDKRKVVKGPYRDYGAIKKLEQRDKFFRSFPVIAGVYLPVEIDEDAMSVLFELITDKTTQEHKVETVKKEKSFYDPVCGKQVEPGTSLAMLTKGAAMQANVYFKHFQALALLPRLEFWIYMMLRYVAGVGDTGLFNVITDGRGQFYGIDHEENHAYKGIGEPSKYGYLRHFIPVRQMWSSYGHVWAHGDRLVSEKRHEIAATLREQYDSDAIEFMYASDPAAVIAIKERFDQLLAILEE